MSMRLTRLALVTVGMALTACADSEAPTDPAIDPAVALDFVPQAGAVYVMTNAAAGNAVVAFDRGADGSLQHGEDYATGGLGTGAGLGNQNGIALSPDGRWLLVVNAGSHDVSAFAVRPGGLELTDVEGSGGQAPISVTIHGSLVYVLNAGGAGNISGFTLSNDGDLSPIGGSTRPLSGAATGPAQIEFTPNGNVLVVTEKATNRILSYVVGADGRVAGPNVFASHGQTPFGFAFSRQGHLIVSEAFGGAADASAMSSYRVEPTGAIQLISASVPTTETAACWAVVTENNLFTYTTNAGSGTISGYRVGPDGSLGLLDADGETGVTGPGTTPLDAAVPPGSRHLYVLNAGDAAIRAFRIGPDGSLEPTFRADVPAGANGLAAR